MPPLRRSPARLLLALVALLAPLVVAGVVAAPGATSAGVVPATTTSWWSGLGVRRDPAAGLAGAAGGPVRVDPSRAFAFTVDLAAARRATGTSARSTTDLLLPDPSGRPVAFTLEPVAVMAPSLAAAHPDVATYRGRGVADPRLSVRVDVSSMGVHASVRTLAPGGGWYVDPARTVEGARLHLAYRAADLPTGASAFVERTDGSAVGLGVPEATGAEPARSRGGELLERHVYGLALLNDPTYSARFGSRVLEEKVALVQRVDQIYAEDLNVHLQLVAGTDRLDLATEADALGADGPCGAQACFTTTQLAECSTATLSANQRVVDAILGPASYDVGHLVLGTDGGGIASLGVVGSDRSQARGCTGLSDPVGDAFFVDYVSHELGHQFGAQHSFDGAQGACGPNRSGSSAVEPGSGSTVMAYAGICGVDDLQRHSDPYLSQRSIAQVRGYLDASPARAGATAPSQNHAPVVAAPRDARIPARTPFRLEAVGSDSDGDALSYLWEQDDAGGASAASLRSVARTDGPLFRVFGDDAQTDEVQSAQSPSPGLNAVDGSTARTFPDLAQVLRGETNAATGECAARQSEAGLDCQSELLPTRQYDARDPLTFRVTARDGAADGGVAHDDVELTLVPDAGPLLVTAPAGGSVLRPGGPGVVTWDVNRTDRRGLAPQVRVALSDDGGATWSHVLAASTPNDGLATVTWPDLVTDRARVRVEAVGGYFFAVNDAEFSLAPDAPVDTTPPATRVVAGPRDGGFALGRTVRLGWRSDADTAGHVCMLDGTEVDCRGDGTVLRRVDPGSHAFSVRAVDAAGNVGAPAVRRWARPDGVRALRAGRGWRTRTTRRAYLGAYRETSARGRSLVTRVRRAERVALVVRKGRRDGRVVVSVGGRWVGTARLGARRDRRSVLVVLPALDRPRSGRLVVRTRDGRRVRIEGLGVLTR